MKEFENHKIANAALPFIFHNYIFERSFKSGNNWHENIELLCIYEGCAKVVNNGVIYTLNEGEIAVIDKNALHFIYSDSAVKCYCLIIDHNFCVENCFNVDNIHFSPVVKDCELFKLIKKFHIIYSEKEISCRILELRSLLLQISLILCRRHAASDKVEYEDTRILFSIKQVIEKIHNEYNNQLSLDLLSKTAGINRSYLSRSFHKITGYTVIEYINHTRCENAKKLLKVDEIKIEEVAHLCGFENPSYFYRTFSKVTGMRPGEYRKRKMIKNKI